jgi:hypothetical protein
MVATLETLERLGADAALMDHATFCEHSGFTSKELSEAVAGGRVLRIDDAEGVPAYPAFHVDPTINHNELFAVMKRISDFPPAAQWLFLTTPKGSLANEDGRPRTPLGALRDGDFDKVERMAACFVEY